MIPLPPWLFAILLMLGMIFVFSGFEQNRIFMGFVGGTMLLILSIVTYNDGIYFISGSNITVNESQTTVQYVYTSIKNETTETLALLLFIIGLYGMTMPILDRISAGVRGKW